MRYPLEIENIGADTYMLMSRGHHDFKEFMKAAKEAHPSWPMGKPEHVWYKTVPARGGYAEVIGFDSMYIEVAEGVRGAWPATLTIEAYGEDRYRD